MAFLQSLIGAGKLAFGGMGRRMMTGTMIGGVYGGITSESNTPGGIIRDMMKGGIVGGAAGLATSAFTPRFYGLSGMPGPTNYAARSAVPWSMAAARKRLGYMANSPAARIGMGAGRAGIGLARAAWRHPIPMAVAGGTAYGLYALGQVGASNLSPEEMAGIATAHGGPSTGFMPGMGASRKQEARMMFMDSTHGLVQGLHAGRRR